MITIEMCRAAFQALQDKTKKKCIVYEPRRASNLGLKSSKLGGLPYLPDANAIPHNSEGENLMLLAQINCEELPQNDFYIEKGILQFWIYPDEYYGLDFDNPKKQENFRVCYYENISEGLSEDEVKKIYEQAKDNEDDICFPLDGEYAMDFKGVDEIGMSLCYEDNFEEAFVKIFNKMYPGDQIEGLAEIEDDVFNRFFESHKNKTFVLGGCPYFAQCDPRVNGSSLTELLLQIDSLPKSEGDGYDIIWADGGVANFFISQKNLSARDFTEVLYNWDCD